MPAIKKCPYCKEILFCKTCGSRLTPDLHRGRGSAVSISPELKKEMKKRAKELGITLRRYMELMLEQGRRIVESQKGKKP